MVEVYKTQNPEKYEAKKAELEAKLAGIDPRTVVEPTPTPKPNPHLQPVQQEAPKKGAKKATKKAVTKIIKKEVTE